MLSHANLLDAARMYVEPLDFNETHSLYQFLPLAHVLARVAQAVVLSAGARICYWSGDPARIIDELSELEPTHFPAVPRVYEKIHGAVLGRIQDGPALQRAIFDWALERGKRARARLREGQLARRHRRVSSTGWPIGSCSPRFAASSAGKLQLALVGAARVAPELLEFFDACGVLVLEGYGLSESCSVATLNTPHGHALRHRRQATAGDRGLNRRRR